jgi:hypothetical protein
VAAIPADANLFPERDPLKRYVTSAI